MNAHNKGGNMNQESRIVRVETVIEHIQFMLDRMDKRFDNLEQKMDSGFAKLDAKMDSGFAKSDAKIEKLNDKIDSRFMWTIGIIITLFVVNGFSPLLVQAISKFIN